MSQVVTQLENNDKGSKVKVKISILRFAIGLFAGAAASPVLADGADEPIPSYYQEPGLSTNRAYTDQHPVERIDPFTGKLQLHHVDLFLPGPGGMDLKVQRSYTSLGPGDRPIERAGVGWTMHFGRVLRKANNDICDTVNFGTTTNPVLELPDGSRHVLYITHDRNGFITKGLWYAHCGGGGLYVYSPDGVRYDMNAPGPHEGTGPFPVATYYASRITDRNGNTISINYQGSAPKTVSTSDGREVVFEYDANSLIKSVSDGSRTTHYEYEPIPNVSNSFFLKKVIRPDGRSWSYDYNLTPYGTAGSLSLKSVTYPTGGSIEYEYGFVQFSNEPFIPSSEVIVKKTAQPGGTWQWLYTPASATLQSDEQGRLILNIPPTAEQQAQLDRTTMIGPDENRTYYHVGYKSAYPGVRYLIGYLLGTASAEQNEAFSAASMEISEQIDVKPGEMFAEAGILVPLRTQHFTGRFGETFTTRYSNFDEFGNPQTITEIGSATRVTNLTYHIDTSKWIIQQKKDETITLDGETLQIERTFDARGNLGSETRAGVKTEYTYTDHGDIHTRTDARGQKTTFEQHALGIPKIERQPGEVIISRTVDAVGNVTSETDGEGATTRYEYDGMNRVIRVDHPIGNPVTVAWGATSRTVTRGPYREVTTFDGFGRRVGVQHSDTAREESIARSFHLDSLGRNTFASYPNSSRGVRFAYDGIGRPIATYHDYDPATQAWASRRTRNYQSYSIREVDENGRNHRFDYRAFGDPAQAELTAIWTPLDAAVPSTTITRNVAGQTTSVTQDGVTRHYGYDEHFFLTGMEEPETGVTVMGRDAVGNLISRTVGASGETTYSYDGRNRLIRIDYPEGTPAVVKTYFKDDKLKSIDNGLSLLSYAYDDNKNLLGETLTTGGKSFAWCGCARMQVLLVDTSSNAKRRRPWAEPASPWKAVQTCDYPVPVAPAKAGAQFSRSQPS